MKLNLPERAWCSLRINLVVYSPNTDRIGFFWRVIILPKFIIHVSSLSQYNQFYLSVPV